MKISFFFSLLTLLHVSYVNGKEVLVKRSFIPMTIECTIFAEKFPGVKDTSINDLKVTLAGENSTREGQQLVYKLGNYEFWVTAGESLLNSKRTEIYSYNAEIRNMDTLIVSQAKSSDSVKNQYKRVIKESRVALLTYNSNPSDPNYLLNSSTLSMSCVHFPNKNKGEALILSH